MGAAREKVRVARALASLPDWVIQVLRPPGPSVPAGRAIPAETGPALPPGPVLEAGPS